MLKTEQELRQYYRDILSGDGVCTVTEDEFVSEAKEVVKDGLQIALIEVDGLPTCIDIDRLGMIQRAQQLGLTVYETCVFNPYF